MREEEVAEVNIELLVKIGEKIDKLAKKLEIPEEIRNLREKIKDKIKKIGESKKDFLVYAIDSSYSMPSIEVLGGEIFVYSYGYLSNKGEKTLFGGIDFFENIEKVSKFLIEKEREILKKILEEKDAEMIIIDGPIANFPGIPFRIPEKYESLMKDIFRLAKEKNTILVGFPKRVRTLFLSMLSKSKNYFYDRAIASYLLKRGEYFVLGKIKEVVEEYAEYLKSIGKSVHSNPKEAIEKIPDYGEIYIVFFKSIVGNKVEIFLPDGYEIDEIIAYLYKECSNFEFPFILNEVDKFVRVNVGDTVNAYLNLLKKAKKEAVLDILPLANPQKKYLFKRS